MFHRLKLWHRKMKIKIIFCIFLCVSIMFSIGYTFSLSVRVNGSEATIDEPIATGQSNIINGSFEDPDKKSLDEKGLGYLYTPQGEISGWKTTSTKETIELGWLKKDGTSPHMIPTVTTEIISGIGASDGWQFAETLGNERSAIYQSLVLDADVLYNWTLHHRGRNGVDTLALFFVKDNAVNYVKSAKTDSDHFDRIITWMKTQNVDSPAAGDQASYTVYTTPLRDNGAFEASDAGYFSFTADAAHTVKFEVHLMSTGKEDWGEYTGTYLPEGENVLFAMSCFKTASSSATSGNLVDNLSFSSSYENTNLLKNPGFETEVSYTSGYYMANAANATNPFGNIGWSTTASDYKVEIGTLRGGKDAYGLGVTFNTVTYNAPSIRDGDQFAELNADQESSLYQIVDTDPGKMYKWSLSHRGRSGLDTMALVIGPNQPYIPKKVGETSKDQLMQIVEWLYSQKDVVLDVPNQTQGCSNEIKLYTPKFNANGGFEGSGDIFSWYKDETHTEEWSVWVIASLNDAWHDYGEIDSTANYNYDYIVPQGQENTIFGFVSVNSAPRNGGVKDKTYGNFLDNITFKEYYYINSGFDGNNNVGHVYIKENEGYEDTFIFDDHGQDSGWAIAGSQILIHFQVGERNFIGAYVNGVFVPKEDWTYNEETNEYSYLFNNVSSTLVINVVYQAQQVIYDSRNAYTYQYDLSDPTSGSEVPMGNGGVLLSEYTSHAPEADDGWEFVGWKYIDHKEGANITYFFAAEHIVKCSDDQTTLSIWEVDGEAPVVDDIPYSEGILFLAEWKYRQRAVAQTFDKLTDRYEIGTYGGTVEIRVAVGDTVAVNDYKVDDVTVGKELYTSNTYTSDGVINDTYINVVAKNTIGFVFSGWYGVSDNLVSRNPSYTYKVVDRGVMDLYAHFDPIGYDVIIDVREFSDSENSQKYFAIDCTFSNLRDNHLYAISGLPEGTITFNGAQVVNPTVLYADSSGNATATLYMKNANSATFVHLPENCVYSVVVQEESKSGYSVRGEAFGQTLTEATTIALSWYKAVQKHVWLASGKHYMNIFSQVNEDTITITPESSYTFYTETQYVPSGYAQLTSALCFFTSQGVAQNFALGTRILMIDSSESDSPKFYAYTVSAACSEIPLTEFSVLGTTSDEKYAMPTGDIRTDAFVFVVDYLDASDVQSGMISLTYRDSSDAAINPVKKGVNIAEDKTELTVTSVSHDGYLASDRPVTIGVAIKNSKPAVNTTYEDQLYAVTLSRNGGTLPVGSYVKVDLDCYYCDNGYIKIPLRGDRNYTLKLYTSLPVYSSMELKVTLLSAISISAQYSVEKSETVNLNFVNGQSCAMRVDIPEKVLSLGLLSQIDVNLKYQELDSVLLTISKKNADGTYTRLLDNIAVRLPIADEPVTIDFGNGLNVESGATYIFSYVGYLDGYSMCFEECMVVGSYI